MISMARDLGRTGERAGREAGAERVDGGKLRAKLAFDRADQVHDMRVALDDHQVTDTDAAVGAHASDVVASQVHQHDVLGALLGIGEQIVGAALVLFFVLRARPGTGDGPVIHLPLLDPHQELRRRADDVDRFGVLLGVYMQPQEVHVGRWIHDAERAIDGERIAAGIYLEALRNYCLEDVSRSDVLSRALYGADVIRLTGAFFDDELLFAAIPCPDPGVLRQRLRELAFQCGEPLECGGVGCFRRLRSHIRVHNQQQLLLHVVEGDHLVEESQTGVGYLEIVLGAGGEALDLANGVVCEEADGTGGKRRQSSNMRRGMTGKRGLQRRKDIALDRLLPLALPGGHLATASDQLACRPDAHERIAAQFFAAFDRFQQEALRLIGGEPQEGGNRRLQVRYKTAADRDQRVGARQLEELRERRKQGFRIGSNVGHGDTVMVHGGTHREWRAACCGQGRYSQRRLPASLRGILRRVLRECRSR